LTGFFKKIESQAAGCAMMCGSGANKGATTVDEVLGIFKKRKLYRLVR
jgi:hypothetical protein